MDQDSWAVQTTTGPAQRIVAALAAQVTVITSESLCRNSPLLARGDVDAEVNEKATVNVDVYVNVDALEWLFIVILMNIALRLMALTC